MKTAKFPTLALFCKAKRGNSKTLQALMLKRGKVTTQVKGDNDLGQKTFSRHEHSTICLHTRFRIYGDLVVEITLFSSGQRRVLKSYIILWMSTVSLKYEALGISLKKMILYDSTFFFLMCFSLFFCAADIKQWRLFRSEHGPAVMDGTAVKK